MNLAVIFGGKSDEHEVSRNSAVNVLTALEENGHDILVVGITKAGRWYATKASHEEIANGDWEKRADNRQAVIRYQRGRAGIFAGCRQVMKKKSI